MKNPDIRIAFADDEEDKRAILETMLPLCYDEKRAEVRTARNGIELVDLVRTYHPHIVLSDNNMPEMNGVAAVKQLRNEGFTEPVLILSGLDADARVEGNGLENIHFLLKPYNLKDLKKKIRQIWPDYSPD